MAGFVLWFRWLLEAPKFDLLTKVLKNSGNFWLDGSRASFLVPGYSPSKSLV